MDFQLLTRQLIKHEGLKLHPYRDTVGKVTIGVGHNLTDKGITASQALAILNDDLKDTIYFLEAHFDWFNSLDEVRQRALVDMTFNLMSKVLDFKDMIAALKAKDWGKAADALLDSKFAAQTGQRAKDIAQMIRTGQDI